MTTIWSQQIDPGSVLPEYPRPQFRRENWICLNGPWDYTFTKKSKRPERPDGHAVSGGTATFSEKMKTAISPFPSM